jgi:hypothetical protein
VFEVWGKLPEKERAKAMAELSRALPERYKEIIEKYRMQLQKDTGSQPGSGR